MPWSGLLNVDRVPPVRSNAPDDDLLTRPKRPGRSASIAQCNRDRDQIVPRFKLQAAHGRNWNPRHLKIRP